MQAQRNWLNALLLMLLVYTSAARLRITEWIGDLILVETAAALGVILGMALGASRFKQSGVRWLALGYSLLALPLILAEIIHGENDLSTRLLSLAGRVVTILGQLLNRADVPDPLFFLLLMGLLFWVIGLLCGFKFMRHGAFAWAAILPSLPLLIVQYYDGNQPRGIWMMAFYFLLFVLLFGRIALHRRQERWQENGVFTGSESLFDLNYNLAIISLGLVMLAWLLPTPSAALPVAARWWETASEPFENTRKSLDSALAALRRISPGVEQYGEVMGLGRNAASGDDTLLTVRPPAISPLPRLYWRARTYDTYENGAWQTVRTFDRDFSPDAPLPKLTLISAQALKEFEFDWQGNSQTMLVLPPQVAWVSREGAYEAASAEAGEFELFSLKTDPALQSGDRYTARADLRNVTILQLREAGEKYPAWAKTRYLQLPGNLSPQLTSLARRLTENEKTPYDKAQAITNYLRAEISYSPTIPDPPPGIDPLNWFLFTWKSGFCNYYATAEVLLLRAAGIPARLSVGYAQGEWQNGRYTVRQRDAHAWPEVFFPGIGWVEFEPTTNQNALARPSGINFPAPLPERPKPETGDDLGEEPRAGREVDDPTEPDSTANTWRFSGQNVLWVIIATYLLILALWVWRGYTLKIPTPWRRVAHWLEALYRRNEWKTPRWLIHWVRWSDASDIEHAFHAINQCLGWFKQPQAAQATAAERVAALQALLPEAEDDLAALSWEHEQALFGKQPGDPARARRAGWNIRYRAAQKLVRIFFYGA